MSASYLYTSSQHSIVSFYLYLQSEDYQCSTCMCHNPQLGTRCSGHIAFSFYLLWKPNIEPYLHVPSLPLSSELGNEVRCTPYLPVMFLVSPLYLVFYWHFAPVYVCVYAWITFNQFTPHLCGWCNTAGGACAQAWSSSNNFSLSSGETSCFWSLTHRSQHCSLWKSHK